MAALPNIGNKWCLVGELNKTDEVSNPKRYFPRRLSLPLIKKHVHNAQDNPSGQTTGAPKDNIIFSVKDNNFSTTFAVIRSHRSDDTFNNKEDFFEKPFGLVVKECSGEKDGHFVRLPPLRLNIRHNPVRHRKQQQTKTGSLTGNTIISYSKGNSNIEPSENTPRQNNITKPHFYVKQNAFVSSNMPEGLKYVKEKSKIILQANNRTLALRRKKAIDNAKVLPTMEHTNGLFITRNRTILLPTLDVELQGDVDVLSTNNQTPRTVRRICWAKKKHTPRKSTFNDVTQDNYDVDKRSLITDLVKSVPYGPVNSPQQRETHIQMETKPTTKSNEKRVPLQKVTPVATTTAVNIQDILIPASAAHETRTSERFRPKSVTSLKNIKKRHLIEKQIRKVHPKIDSPSNVLQKVTLGDTLAACCTLSKGKRISSLYPLTPMSTDSHSIERSDIGNIGAKHRKPNGNRSMHPGKLSTSKWCTQPKNIYLKFENKSNIIHQSKSLRYYAAKRHGGNDGYEKLMNDKRYQDKLAMTDIYLSGQSNDHTIRAFYRDSKADILDRNKTSGSTFSYIPSNPPPSAASMIDVDLTLRRSRNEVFGVVQEELASESGQVSDADSVTKYPHLLENPIRALTHNIRQKPFVNTSAPKLGEKSTEQSIFNYQNNVQNFVKSYSVSDLFDKPDEDLANDYISYDDKAVLEDTGTGDSVNGLSLGSSVDGGDLEASLPVPVYEDLKLPTHSRSYMLDDQRRRTILVPTADFLHDSSSSEVSRAQKPTPSIEVTIDDADPPSDSDSDLANQFSNINLTVSKDTIISGW